MASNVCRRRFLASAANGTAAGVAATVVASAHGAESPQLSLPDAATQGSVDGTGPEAECGTPANTIVFACSGAADVGKIAASDRRDDPCNARGDCTRKSLEEAGIKQFEHLRLTDLGMKKGQFPVSDESVGRVVTCGKQRLASRFE